VLVSHADEIDGVELWQRHHDDRVVVFHEGQATLVTIVLNQRACATSTILGNHVALDMTTEEGLDVEELQTLFLPERDLCFFTCGSVFKCDFD